jgi:hypothetical protein
MYTYLCVYIYIYIYIYMMYNLRFLYICRVPHLQTNKESIETQK